MTRKELYLRTYEFLVWLDKTVDLPNIGPFTRGMVLLNENISADPDVRYDWDKMVPETIAPEDGFAVLKQFFAHWIKKDDLYVFERVLYYFKEGDMDYKPEVAAKWMELMERP